jgi:hypothetical protein
VIEALAIGIACYSIVLYLRSWVIRWEIYRHWTSVRSPDRYWEHPPDIAGMIAPVYGTWFRNA